MEEITAAEWLQAWGSIVGAALGAGLAIAGAVWIQHRTDRRRARAYASTLYAIIERIRACIRRLLVAIDENQHTSTKEAMLRELVRHGDVLQRFIPFAELDDFDQAEFLVEICNQVEDLKRPIANLDDQRAQSAQARGAEPNSSYQRLLPEDWPDIGKAARDLDEHCRSAQHRLLD